MMTIIDQLEKQKQDLETQLNQSKKLNMEQAEQPADLEQIIDTYEG